MELDTEAQVLFSSLLNNSRGWYYKCSSQCLVSCWQSKALPVDSARVRLLLFTTDNEATPIISSWQKHPKISYSYITHESHFEYSWYTPKTPLKYHWNSHKIQSSHQQTSNVDIRFLVNYQKCWEFVWSDVLIQKVHCLGSMLS